jgi:hypothetical protein
MNRLSIINFINPSWYKQITEFLAEHPGYNKLVPIVALDEYPSGFNKNPHETDDDAPCNIFETIIYGIAHANADIEYGKSQYLQIVNYLRKHNYFTENMEFPFDVEEIKVRTYIELINTLLENNIIINEMKFEELHIVENVYGMTESTLTLLNLLYAEVTSEKVIPFSDKQFNRGMGMFYDLKEKQTIEQLKEITNTWNNKKVGLMFIIQFAHYSDFI